MSVVVLLAGLALEVVPRHTYAVTAAAGVAVLVQFTPQRFAAYEIVVVATLFLVRGRTRLLAAVLAIAIFVVPKELFRLKYHHPEWHGWLNPFLLGHIALMTAYWWMERRRGRATQAGLGAWFTLFLFPTHPTNPINLGPTHLWRERSADARAVLEGAALVAAKAIALGVLLRHLPGARFKAHTGDTLAALPWLNLWGVVGFNYLLCALTLSGTSDVVVLIGRALGWPLPHPYRWALLAWNPVELWRRWAIYNRKLLLTLVYFPLGGSQRRRMFNVLCTFLASGLILHSGWVGSKYWAVGPGGWRDQTVYFLLQGVAVCACLTLWRLTGKDPASDRRLRWSAGRVLGTMGTQALSAALHVLVLATHVEWSQRWRLIAALVGLGTSAGP
jgi:hypothetical protein